MADEVDVLLYGASGFTGRLIVQELAASGVSFRVAGRDAGRLAEAVRGVDRQVEQVEVHLDDAVGLERAARGARVVLSAAGPFVDLGPPLLRSALDAGSHFVDISGEQSWLRAQLAHDAEAKAVGVTVVGAMGFDVVPSDVAALVSTTAMRSVRRVDIGVRVRTGTSGGTLRSMARMAGAGWWFVEGAYRPIRVGRTVRTFPFPAPTGERLGAEVPWGDVVTAPRSTGARTVRTFFCPGDRRVRRLHRAWPLVAFAWRTRLARLGLAARVRANEDPTPAARARSSFEILAEAEDDEGVVQRGYVTGRDPYGLTAALAAYAARGLAQGEAPRGVCTPTQAFRFGPLAEAMAPRFGFAWRARSLTDDVSA